MSVYPRQIYWVALCNPFSHAVEVIRFAPYGKFNGVSSAFVVGVGLVALALAVRGDKPLMGVIGQICRD